MGILWSTSYPLGRYLAPYEAPQAIVVIRGFIAFAFLIVIARRRSQARIKLSPNVIGQLVLLGICGFCLHNFLLFEALEHTQANTGAVINGAIPVVVVILDYLIFRRTIGRWSIAGVGLSFIGALIVVSHGEVTSIFHGAIGYGELLFLIAIFGWAMYTIVARPLLERYSAAAVSAYACFAGGVLMLPWMLSNLAASIALLSQPSIILLLIIQGILTMGLGFLWYYEGVQQLGPMNASVYTNLVPIFGVALAAMTIGEVPDPPLLLGGTLVIGGLLLVNRVESYRQQRIKLAQAS